MTDLRKAAEMALEALEVATTPLAKDRQEVIAAQKALRQALAQLDSTSDSAESFCKQELHNLMSVAGRMALEIECLLLDTKDLSVVSKWWDTGMESLQAYRDYIWSITHGKEEIIALAQPEQEPVAYAAVINGEIDWNVDYPFSNEPFTCFDDENAVPLYTSPPRKEWVRLTDDEIAESAEHMEAVDPTDSFWREFSQEIEAKLKEKNHGL